MSDFLRGETPTVETARVHVRGPRVRAPSEPWHPAGVSQDCPKHGGSVTVECADFWRAVASPGARRKVYFLRVQPQSAHIGIAQTRSASSYTWLPLWTTAPAAKSVPISSASQRRCRASRASGAAPALN